MPDPALENVRHIVREEIAPVAARVITLQGDMTEVKTEVNDLHAKIDRLLNTVDGFVNRLTKEEDERTSADHLLERRLERLEQGSAARLSAGSD